MEAAPPLSVANKKLLLKFVWPFKDEPGSAASALLQQAHEENTRALRCRTSTADFSSSCVLASSCISTVLMLILTKHLMFPIRATFWEQWFHWDLPRCCEAPSALMEVRIGGLDFNT